MYKTVVSGIFARNSYILKTFYMEVLCCLLHHLYLYTFCASWIVYLDSGFLFNSPKILYLTVFSNCDITSYTQCNETCPQTKIKFEKNPENHYFDASCFIKS